MIRHENPAVQGVGEEIANMLADAERIFKPGVKLTFLARRPGFPEQDMIITNDEIGEVAAMVDRRRRAAEKASGVMTTISDEEDDICTQVRREGMTLPIVLRVIQQAEHDAAHRVFTCDDCRHVGSDGDGPEYNGTWPVCNKHPALSEHPKFPFEVAPAGCFELDEAFADLTYGTYTETSIGHPGAFALSRCTDACGRLRQGGTPEPLARAIFYAMADPIEWEPDDDSDAQSGVTKLWREMKGWAHPADERIRRQSGHGEDFNYGVTGWGTDLIPYREKRHLPITFKDAMHYTETCMRENAIRRLIAEFEAVGG